MTGEELSEISEVMNILAELAHETWLTVHSLDVSVFSQNGKDRVGEIRLETLPNDEVSVLFAPTVTGL